jgi:molecular chaperone GrpE (heat shock protein)
MLDVAVESLRRLLGELIEQRLEAVARQAAEVHREVAAGADRARVLELVDDLLERLGASRFTAQPLDAVDPLIHVVVEELRADGVPAGVILEAVRPGFRTGRGLVLARAAVTVSEG